MPLKRNQGHFLTYTRRAAKEACCSRYVGIYALAVLKTPSNCVDTPISHGELPAYGVYFCLDGMRYVRVVLVVYGPGPARMQEL